jgi:hypothetical protein
MRKMKIKYCLLVLVAARIVLSGCSGKMSPHTYNRAILQMHAESWEYLSLVMEQIYNCENMSKEDAKLLIDSLDIKYDGYIARLRQMKYPDAAADWRQAATHFFVYLKDSVIPLCGEALTHEPGDDEWYEVWNKIDCRLQERASNLESLMITKQEEFAAAANKNLQ